MAMCLDLGFWFRHDCMQSRKLGILVSKSIACDSSNEQQSYNRLSSCTVYRESRPRCSGRPAHAGAAAMPPPARLCAYSHRIDPVIIVSMHETENRLNRFYPGDSTEPSMESILDLVVSSTVVALVQAHSHKKLTGFSQTAEICHERSSQAPGVGLGRNCRSLRVGMVGECTPTQINTECETLQTHG